MMHGQKNIKLYI